VCARQAGRALLPLPGWSRSCSPCCGAAAHEPRRLERRLHIPGPARLPPVVLADRHMHVLTACCPPLPRPLATHSAPWLLVISCMHPRFPPVHRTGISPMQVSVSGQAGLRPASQASHSAASFAQARGRQAVLAANSAQHFLNQRTCCCNPVPTIFEAVVCRLRAVQARHARTCAHTQDCRGTGWRGHGLGVSVGAAGVYTCGLTMITPRWRRPSRAASRSSAPTGSAAPTMDGTPQAACKGAQALTRLSARTAVSTRRLDMWQLTCCLARSRYKGRWRCHELQPLQGP